MNEAAPVTLLIALVGGLTAYLVIAWITRHQPTPPLGLGRSLLGQVWLTVALLVLIDVFFIIARVAGVQYAGHPEDVNVVFDGFYHWLAFAVGIGIAMWAHHAWVRK